ncbi:MAG: hypothetical protein JZU70_11075 [Chlorobium sp.]|jgi:hypothetical protein|nr:hypothetical protein [Chlorobium sp.]
MAMTFVDVSTYLVFAYGGPGGNAGAEATVSLGIPDAFAFLRFFPDSIPLPANSKTTHVSGKPMFYVSYKYAQLANVIDLLRNEKPIRFFFADDTKASYLTTSDEPVGEGEN